MLLKTGSYILHFIGWLGTISDQFSFKLGALHQMPHIRVRENEPLDLVGRRFRRICEKDGLFKRLNFLESYKKPSEIRKLQREIGRKRAYRRMLRDNPVWLK